MANLSETTRKILRIARENGYFNIRVIEDEIVIACTEMLFTTAVLLNINEGGFEGRICYPTRAQAVACCNHFVNMDDDPLPGYTALK